ncbi:MAG: hypothetical protein DHS20C18_39450 [Saprospiraceae bacterium]|nr:MAG: hypothetical protein DHS20C18_39450 [Saprospiraceae bacterium]
MTQHQKSHLDALSEIRSLMERSSRFISLSGLSGVAAGTFALIGAALIYVYFGIVPFEGKSLYYALAPATSKWGMHYLTFLMVNGGLVLISALAAGIFFTTRKARHKGQKIWGPLTQRLLINLAIPLATGGIFCLALFKHGYVGLMAPATLIFYGLSLVNASKYTLNDVRYLGISEILLGLLAMFNLGYGLEFWALGFGVLHIIYGLLMYFKYEREALA